MDGSQLANINAPKPKDKEDPANSDNAVVNLMSQSAETGAKLAAKMVGGGNLGGLVSSIGSVSMFGQISSEGIANKPVAPSMLPDAQGGLAAKLMATLFKGGFIAKTESLSYGELGNLYPMSTGGMSNMGGLEVG